MAKKCYITKKVSRKVELEFGKLEFSVFEFQKIGTFGQRLFN